MSEERKIILNMLAEGKIDAEQASELLGALEAQLREEWLLQGYGSGGPAGDGGEGFPPEGGSLSEEGFPPEGGSLSEGGFPPAEGFPSGEDGPEAAGAGASAAGADASEDGVDPAESSSGDGGRYTAAGAGGVGWSAEGVGRRAQEIASKVGASMEVHVQNIPHFVQGVLSKVNVAAVADLFGPAYVFVDEGTAEFHDGGEPVLIDVTGFNGAVKLETWDEPHCRYVLTKRVYHRDEDAAKTTAADLARVTAGPSGLAVAARQPEARRAGVTVEIWLPARRVYALKVRTANGRVSVQGLKGTRFDLVTANGRIEANDIDAPELDVATSNARIDVSGRFARLKAVSSNGRLSVRVDEAARPRCTLDLATSNGKITVAVPADAGVSVDAATGLGGVEVDVPRLVIDEEQELAPGRRPRALKARSSGETDGSVHIDVRARTSSGSISVVPAAVDGEGGVTSA